MNEALFPSEACVQVAVLVPMSSNPSLHVYVAVSPVELPVTFTSPLVGAVGYEHRAKRQETTCGISYTS